MITNEGKEIANYWKDDPYYDRAENWLSCFWDKDSIFFKRFKELDLSSVVELACGHGRHVSQYVDEAGAITLVDVNKENIEHCRKRFNKYAKIGFLQNSGNDFDFLPSSSVTAIFTYDAMVHFNIIDIMNYLKESYRILVPGGRILFHHSNNYDAKLGEPFIVNANGRNFMSDKIFASMAMSFGFNVLSQDIFDWESGTRAKNLDCLSLCEKSKNLQREHRERSILLRALELLKSHQQNTKSSKV